MIVCISENFALECSFKEQYSVQRLCSADKTSGDIHGVDFMRQQRIGNGACWFQTQRNDLVNEDTLLSTSAIDIIEFQLVFARSVSRAFSLTFLNDR